jgi:arginyl-tRNA synthetase
MGNQFEKKGEKYKRGLEYKGVKIYKGDNVYYFRGGEGGQIEGITIGVCKILIDKDKELVRQAKRDKWYRKWRKWYESTELYEKREQLKEIKREMKEKNIEKIKEIMEMSGISIDELINEFGISYDDDYYDD